MTDTSWMAPGAEDGRPPTIDLRTDLPHPARIYDYLLGGKDNISQGVWGSLHSGLSVVIQ
jgi:hypothetical protein